MLRINQAGKGLRIALLAHMPIGSPGKLPPRRLATGLGHAREPEINAIGQNRSEESLPIFGRHLGAQMQESIAQTRPLIDLGEQFGVSPTKVRKVPQDSCQLPGRKGFSAIPELPRRDLV